MGFLTHWMWDGEPRFAWAAFNQGRKAKGCFEGVIKKSVLDI